RLQGESFLARLEKSQPADQQLPLKNHFLRQIPRQPQEKFFLPNQLRLDVLEIQQLQLLEALAGYVEAVEIDVLGARHPADDGFFRVGSSVRTLDDPFEDAHVFAEAGPHELAVVVLAEPIDVKN